MDSEKLFKLYRQSFQVSCHFSPDIFRNILNINLDYQVIKKKLQIVSFSSYSKFYLLSNLWRKR